MTYRAIFLYLIAMLLGGVASVAANEADNTPPDDDTKVDDTPVTNDTDDTSASNHGYLAFGNMSFHEDMTIAGAPFSLHYSSQRTPGYVPANVIRVWYKDPASDSTNLVSVKIEVRLAGRVFKHSAVGPFPADPWEMTWDGRDEAGSLVYGTVAAKVITTALYVEHIKLREFLSKTGYGLEVRPPSGYWPPDEAGVLNSQTALSQLNVYANGNRVLDLERIVPYYTSKAKTTWTYVGALPVSAAGLGGWTFTSLHNFDVRAGILHEGGGTDRKAALSTAAECDFEGTNAVPSDDFVVHSSGGREWFTFTPQGLHLKTTDVLTGQDILTFGYDASNRLISVIDRNNLTTLVTRATNGYVQSVTSPFGLRTDFSINSNGWLAALANPAAETNRFLYSTNGLLSNVVTRSGFTHTMTYDSQGQIVRADDPAGGYDAGSLSRGYWGKSITHVMSMGRTQLTIYDRNNDGRERKRVTNPSGATMQSLRSQDGLTEEISYPSGMRSASGSGTDGRFGTKSMRTTAITSATPAGLTRIFQNQTTYALLVPTNPYSQLLAFTNTASLNGKTGTTVFTYSDRSIRQASPMGRISLVEFDSLWRPIRWTAPGLATVTAGYDVFGRMATIQQSNRTVNLTYTTNGFLANVTTVNGQIVRQYSDAIGRVTNVVLTDTNNLFIRQQPSTGPIGVTPPGRPEHLFGYSSVGLMERYSAPSVGVETNQLITWNTARQVTSMRLPDGRVTTNQYAPGGLRTNTSWAEDTLAVSYACDCGLVGQLSLTSGVSIIFQRDGSFLTNVALVVAAITSRVNFTFDNDFRATVVAVNGSNPVMYAYNLDSQLTNAGELALVRDAATGFLTNSTVGGVSDGRSISPFGEIAEYVSSYNGTNLVAFDYGYDLLGRITSRIERILGLTNRSDYAYDSAGRLAEVKTNGSVYSAYQYDANGNRTNATVGTVGATARYDAQDRMTNYGAAVFQYNASGQLTNRTEGSTNTAYRYDTRGGLLEVRPGTNVISYTVDPMGRRMAKAINGTLAQRFVYQDFLKPAAELNTNGTILTRFVYATRVNVPDYIVKTGRTFRVVTDHLGSVRLVVDAQTGAIAQRLDYDEFGRVLLDTNPGFQPFGYAGGLYDKDTGLVRFGYRDYDAGVGRWTVRDPILFGGGQANVFVYVGNDPLARIDPLGLAEENCESSIIGKALIWIFGGSGLTFSAEIGSGWGVHVDVNLAYNEGNVSGSFTIASGIGIGGGASLSKDVQLAGSSPDGFTGAVSVTGGVPGVNVGGHLTGTISNGPEIGSTELGLESGIGLGFGFGVTVDVVGWTCNF